MDPPYLTCVRFRGDGSPPQGAATPCGTHRTTVFTAEACSPKQCRARNASTPTNSLCAMTRGNQVYAEHDAISGRWDGMDGAVTHSQHSKRPGVCQGTDSPLDLPLTEGRTAPGNGIPRYRSAGQSLKASAFRTVCRASRVLRWTWQVPGIATYQQLAIPIRRLRYEREGTEADTAVQPFT